MKVSRRCLFRLLKEPILLYFIVGAAIFWISAWNNFILRDPDRYYDYRIPVADQSQCPIPHLDPYDKTILPLINESISNMPKILCTEYRPVLFNSTDDFQIIPAGRKVWKGLENPCTQCCYRKVSRFRSNKDPFKVDFKFE